MRLATRLILQAVCALMLAVITPGTFGAPTLLIAATPSAEQPDGAMVPGGSLNDCYYCFNMPGGIRHYVPCL